MNPFIRSIVIVAVLMIFAADARAADDLAKQAQNPVANMISLPFQNNTDFNIGPDDDTKNTLNIQPVWPFEITDHLNLITRTIVPVITKPGGLTADGESVTGLGDTTFTAFLSPSDPAKLIWGVGPVFLLPTASDDELGADKWGAGASVVLLTMPGNWVIGSLFSNIWSIGGSGDQDLNVFNWQYFINYNFPKGWYLASAPIIIANWEADSDNRWTIPFGGGVGKIFRIGKQPLNAQLSAYYNVEKPDSGPDWQMRFQLVFLFPK